MKIFYINVIEQHAGWGAEFFVNQGFLKNGHETITLDYRKYRYNLAKRFIALETDFDLLFLQRGEEFPKELLTAVNRPRFFWASELVSRNRDQDRLLSSCLFDHIFVHSKGCKDCVVGRGWIPENRVSVLLNGFDETVHYKMPTMEKDIDVLFVGNVLPRRRKWLDHLKKRHTIVEASAYGAELTALFNRAKIVLNIHAEEYPDTETRVFEALGCGAFLLSEKLSEDSPFSAGVHLAEIDDLTQMEEEIGYYLSNGDERERIAACGHEEALAKQTYSKRAEEIAGVFSRYLKPSAMQAIDMHKVKAFMKKEFVARRLSKAGDLLRAVRGRL